MYSHHVCCDSCVLLLYRGVQYPKLYAEGNNAVSVKFNCVQRVHQNTMENLPVFLIMQILLAQAYPLTAAALGAVWATGEVPILYDASCGLRLLAAEAVLTSLSAHAVRSVG